MLRSIAAAACVLAAGPVAAQLPPSLDRTRIEQCAPASLDAATDCLRDALSAEDRAVLAEPRGSVYRPQLNRLLYDSWQLADATTPLAADLRRLNLYYPGLAPSLVVMNLIGQAEGRRPDWPAVVSALREQPALMSVANDPPFVPPSAMAGGTLLSAKECAAVSGGAAGVEACVRMPDGSVIVRIAAPVDEMADAD